MQGGENNDKNFDIIRFFQTKIKLLTNNNYRVVYKKAWQIFLEIKHKTKRRPYIRSTYFLKEKIFFDYFWEHLRQKNRNDRMRRLKVFEVAIEVVLNSRNKPAISENRNNQNEILYKFYGKTVCNIKICVNIKQNKKTGQKYLMSCYPIEIDS